MQALYIILIITLGSAFGFSQSSDTIFMTYQTGIKLNKIPIPGNEFIFKQLCTTQIDSHVTNGNIAFKHSRVGRIKDCLFEWRIVNDTLRAISIETFDLKQTRKLFDQAIDQYGEPIEILDLSHGVFHRYLVREMPSVTAGLHITEDKTNAKLTVRKN